MSRALRRDFRRLTREFRALANRRSYAARIIRELAPFTINSD